MDAIFEDHQIIKKDRCKKIKGKSSPTFELLSPSQSSHETNEEAYELGDKLLKTADMGNVMEGQDERNNVDDAIKTAEMGKDRKSQGERLNVDDVIKTVDTGKDGEGHDVRLNVDDVIHLKIEALKSCYVQPVDINKAMNNAEKLVWNYLMATVCEKMEGERKKTVKEQKKLNKKKQIAEEEGLEVQQSFMNDVFATERGLESKAFLLDNLLPGKQIYANVIDCWAVVLSHQQKIIGEGSLKQLFCHASTFVEWINTFCEYLESVNHPKAHVMEKMCPRKLKLKWETTDNVTDCGVFVMRHMEMFKGKECEFECGVSDHERRKIAQIYNLRMKNAAKILLSDAKVYKEKVMRDAEETSKKMESNEYGNVIKGLGGYEDIEKALGVTEEAMKDDHKDAYHRIVV
ncbi:hypothetical protein L1987_70656 [Smallanthus sonchifolius]|uniref:Uncharacterized protein n=1 Tax=Smallanthus sonchifolius TaxID=185202 RepID=A0ACB9AQG6_9ASTR|nr:hypothetical protein L1987_70656 [Smallanthus sonchifolius]